jgi:hypothetical protein
MRRWSKPVYRIEATFHAPLEFVFRWLTDFSPRDPTLTGEHFKRRILERSAHRVVFEDLSSTPAGWNWLRNGVALLPPNRWKLDALGNYVDSRADYMLVPVSGVRTQLVMTLRLRPGILKGPVPQRSEIETSLRSVWRTYGRALELDYRKTSQR